MIATLKANRATIGHAVTKGAVTELQWLATLKKYLPERYCADSAFVLDAGGRISQQIDVVIYDRHYSPFLFHEEGVKYVPAESVYAVMEIRQHMDASELAYAGEKAASVRRLRRTSVPITHAGGQFPPKDPPPILAGLLTLNSRLKPAFGEPFENGIAALAPLARLDLGCVLQQGGFEVVYSYDAKPDVFSSSPDTALIFFFVRLLDRLQAMGTVPALDFKMYGRVL